MAVGDEELGRLEKDSDYLNILFSKEIRMSKIRSNFCWFFTISAGLTYLVFIFIAFRD